MFESLPEMSKLNKKWDLAGLFLMSLTAVTAVAIERWDIGRFVRGCDASTPSPVDSLDHTVPMDTACLGLIRPCFVGALLAACAQATRCPQVYCTHRLETWTVEFQLALEGRFQRIRSELTIGRRTSSMFKLNLTYFIVLLFVFKSSYFMYFVVYSLRNHLKPSHRLSESSKLFAVSVICVSRKAVSVI